MNKSELVELLIAAVRKVQSEADEPLQPVTMSTVPMRDLSGFDSPRGLELSCEIDEQISYEIPLDVNIFIDNKTNALLNIGEIADNLLQLKSRSQE